MQLGFFLFAKQVLQHREDVVSLDRVGVLLQRLVQLFAGQLEIILLQVTQPELDVDRARFFIRARLRIHRDAGL